MDDEGSGERPGAADIARYRANLQGEIDGAAIYRTMAAAETNPALRELYGRLAEVETRHGGIWRERMEAAGIATAQLGQSWRNRILMLIARRFGPAAVVASIAEKESTDQLMYDAQPEATSGMPADVASG